MSSKEKGGKMFQTTLLSFTKSRASTSFVFDGTKSRRLSSPSAGSSKGLGTASKDANAMSHRKLGVKENRIPPPSHSSPIPGLTMPGTPAEANDVERGSRYNTGHLGSKHEMPNTSNIRKRKVSDWDSEDELDRSKKRRIGTSGSPSYTSHSLTRDSAPLPPSSPPLSPSSSFKPLFSEDDVGSNPIAFIPLFPEDDIGSNPIIESSQTQILSPFKASPYIGERTPAKQQEQIVRSSQSPSPLNAALSVARRTTGIEGTKSKLNRDVSFEFTLPLKSNAGSTLITRQPGQNSAVPLQHKLMATSPHISPSKELVLAESRHQRLFPSRPARITPSPQASMPPMDGSRFDEPNLFWPTQPLLDFDSPPRSTMLGSTPHEPPPSSIPTTLPEDPENGRLGVDTSPGKASGGSETEQDTSSLSGSPHMQEINPHPTEPDPDKTVVATSSRRNNSSTAGLSLVADSSPTDGLRGDLDADRTMVQPSRQTKDIAENGKEDLSDMIRGVEAMSPFKKRLTGIRKMDESSGRKEHQTPFTLALQAGEVIFITDEDEKESPPKPDVISFATLEETQMEETQTFAGISLPAGWRDMTPQKPKGQPRRITAECSQFPSTACGVLGLAGEDYGSDNIGVEITPRTAERNKPELLRRFEAQGSPYGGMFAGSIESDSDVGSDV